MAEIAFKTRLEAALIDVYSHSIYPNLKGRDHESERRSKANEARFSVDDVEYAKRLTRAFRHALRGQARAILGCLQGDCNGNAY
jgi:hypothetical protein